MKRPANETILAEGDMVTGVNTKFTELFQDRDKLRFRGKSEQFKVGKEGRKAFRYSVSRHGTREADGDVGVFLQTPMRQV